MTDKLISIQTIPVPIVYAEYRTIRDCNDAFAELFGHERLQLINSSFHLLYPDFEDFVRTGRLFRTNFGGKTIYRDERIMRKVDGTPFWARVHGQAELEDDPFARATYHFERISRPVARTRTHLTARQTQILTLVSMGKTNRQIGQELDVSSRTVEAHRARIMRSVGVKNSAALIAWFQTDQASSSQNS